MRTLGWPLSLSAGAAAVMPRASSSSREVTLG
jgi:hypothetical protein